MKITNQMIIDCAKSKGFRLPIQFTMWGMKYNPTEEDITVNRARTAPFAGNKDLGEWWISYPGSITQFRVTDADIKAYIRDINLDKIL